MASSPLNISVPLRADHRLIKKVISITLGGRVEHVLREFNLISSLFSKKGGSWVRLYQEGSVDDLVLLKKIIKSLYKQGRITKRTSW